jgi:predicted RNA-binding Zn ribbon-like protein
MTSSALPHLVGGHLALDLVNSVERGVPVEGRPQVDWLPDWEATVRWAVHAGALTSQEADAARAVPVRRQAEAHRDVVALREAAYPLLLACRGDVSWTDPAVVAARELVEDHWHPSVVRSALTPALSGRGLVPVGTSEPGPMLLDRAVAAVVSLATGPEIDRLKACPVDAGGCAWLFLDHSRNGSRRWCRMADCGTRVKSDRLTERRRAHRQETT